MRGRGRGAADGQAMAVPVTLAMPATKAPYASVHRPVMMNYFDFPCTGTASQAEPGESSGSGTVRAAAAFLGGIRRVCVPGPDRATRLLLKCPSVLFCIHQIVSVVLTLMRVIIQRMMQLLTRPRRWHMSRQLQRITLRFPLMQSRALSLVSRGRASRRWRSLRRLLVQQPP